MCGGRAGWLGFNRENESCMEVRSEHGRRQAGWLGGGPIIGVCCIVC